MKAKNNTIKENKIIDYMIIGNSAAGLAAAEGIRKLDKDRRIVIFTEEEHFNYSKPLITYYLAGKADIDKIYFKDEKFYQDNDLEVKTKTRVEDINADNLMIRAENGDEYKFGKLLIASGGKPIIPKIKTSGTGLNQSGKSIGFIDFTNYKKIDGIFTLTTLDDAIKIKKYIKKNEIENISILGGGLIGLKSAEAFLELGININIIELADRILAATFDREASSIIENAIEDRDSKIYKNNTIEEIYVKNGKINGFRLKDSEEISCNLLVIAIGVSPNIDFVDTGKIKTGRGIIVDDHMQTSVRNIYASGDVAEAWDILLKKSRNIAIWPLAVMQGVVAGNNMAGGSKKYSGGFFMNSVEVLSIPSISMGMTNINIEDHEDIEIIKEFMPELNLYKKIVIRKNKIIGLILIGNIERAGIYSGLIKNKIDLSSVKENISKEDFGIIHFPAEYKKHLVIGEGMEV